MNFTGHETLNTQFIVIKYLGITNMEMNLEIKVSEEGCVISSSGIRVAKARVGYSRQLHPGFLLLSLRGAEMYGSIRMKSLNKVKIKKPQQRKMY